MSNPRLRAILAGCGSICGSWLPHIIEHPDLELVALVDLQPQTARQRAEEFGIPEIPVETDLAEALAHHAPVDIVFDLTIPAAHHAMTLTALRHGCHVLGEKPLSDTIEQARDMVSAAAHAGRIYAVSQNRRYGLGVRRLRAFLDSGVLGRVTTACCDFFMALPAGGFRAVMDHVLLVDMSIHHFDIARFLLGGAAARTVLCHEWNPPNSQFAHGAAAVATFEMEGNATFVYNGSWAAEGFVSSWQGAWRIIGENGTVYWDGETGFQARVADENERNKRMQGQPAEVPALEFPEQSEGHASIIAEFVRAVRGGAPPETICTDNIKSLAMVFGAVDKRRAGHARGTHRLNVLALQLKRIGDLALTTPALLAMKTGGAHVTLVVADGTEAFLPALVGFCVDEALVYRPGGGNFALWKRLVRGGFDACVDFTGRDRSALMTLLSHAPRRVIARPALRKGGWRRLVYNMLVDSSVRSRHTADHYLDHVAALPLAAVEAGEDFPHAALQLPPENIARAGELLGVAGIGEDESFVVVHPGSARAEKYWVPERWAEVIRFVGRECNLRCVLTGGSGDAFETEHLTQIRAALEANTDLCVDFAGRLDLLTLTAMLARTALFVSVDSGPMHLAAAFRRPQIALFGPTNPFHWRPRHADAYVLHSGHGDTPLGKFSEDSPGGRTDAISTEAVIDAIKQVTRGREMQK